MKSHLFLCLLLPWLLTACTFHPQSIQTDRASAVVPTGTAPATELAIGTESPASVDTSAFFIEELTFAGDGETFLAYVERTLRTTNMPMSHRFVSITDEAGVTWQGELVAFEDESLIFLQAAQSGGTHGIQINAPAETTAADLLDLPLPTPPDRTIDSPHPTIEFVRARLTREADAAAQWTFDVTLRYPDTGWEDYADGWQIETQNGEILGTRILLHPHVNEQPFTRSLSGVPIPSTVTTVMVRSHDLKSGYSPTLVAIPLTQTVSTETYEVRR